MTFEEIYNESMAGKSISLPNLEYITIMAKNRSEFSNWQDSYWISKCIDSYANHNASNDEYLVSLLSNAFRTGLNYGSSIDKFFDAILIYIKLQFKYRKYREVENYLLLLRELKFTGFEIPNWVNQFSVVTYYKLEMKMIFSHPEEFIDALDLVTENTEEERRKKVYVIKDFISEVITFVTENSISRDKINLFVEVFESYIQTYMDEIKEDWEEFINLDKKIYPKNEDIKKNPVELINISEEVEKLKGEIARKDNEILDLNLRINDLMQEVRALESENGILVQESENSKNLQNMTSQRQVFVPAKSYISSSNRDIVLIIGASMLSLKDIYGIGKEIGFTKDQLDVYDDYEKNAGFDFTKLRYSSKYSAILYGPNAHSSTGKGDYSSALEMLKKEDGYPPVFEIRNESSGLKITKTSLKKTLQRVMNHIQAKA